jgi:hypothetical protein
LILRTIATELVDMSKNAASRRMPSISPFGPGATRSTSAGTGSEVKDDFALRAGSGTEVRFRGGGRSSFAIRYFGSESRGP